VPRLSNDRTIADELTPFVNSVETAGPFSGLK